jgi:Terminase large subunit, T4likevirus-type, N-terminal
MELWGRDPKKPTVIWKPQPRQNLLLACPVFEVLYGGARGGGKTDAIIGDFASHASKHGKQAVGLVVRRKRTELVEMIERSKQIYGPLGARYITQDKMWRFPNGARLTFAYLENDADADNYQGWNTSYVGVEEMGNFPDPRPILKLMATLRLGPSSIWRFRATANPGGAGHLWIRKRYIDPAPKGGRLLYDTFTNPFTGASNKISRMFIPSRVTDNMYCNNEQYIAQLQLSAGRRLLHAWLHGDWSVIEGAFFEEWDESKHVIKPFVIPPHWTRFTSADWGSAAPFAIHWWAIVPGDVNYKDVFYQVGGVDYGNVPENRRYRNDLPPGAMVCYREWYGSANHSNTGLKLHAEEVARGIVERERYEPRSESGRARIAYRVIDPDACKDKGGPSIAERMGHAPNYVYWQPADNMRVGRRGMLGGWDTLRSRLKGDTYGRPMIYFFDTCEDIIRTLPVMQHDPDNPEDVLEGEDHAPDSVRYACMSRPYTLNIEPKQPDRTFSVGPSNQLTINDVMDDEPSRKSSVRFERIR